MNIEMRFTRILVPLLFALLVYRLCIVSTEDATLSSIPESSFFLLNEQLPANATTNADGVTTLPESTKKNDLPALTDGMHEYADTLNAVSKIETAKAAPAIDELFSAVNEQLAANAPRGVKTIKPVDPDKLLTVATAPKAKPTIPNPLPAPSQKPERISIHEQRLIDERKEMERENLRIHNERMARMVSSNEENVMSQKGMREQHDYTLLNMEAHYSKKMAEFTARKQREHDEEQRNLNQKKVIQEANEHYDKAVHDAKADAAKTKKKEDNDKREAARLQAEKLRTETLEIEAEQKELQAKYKLTTENKAAAEKEELYNHKKLAAEKASNFREVAQPSIDDAVDENEHRTRDL